MLNGKINIFIVFIILILFLIVFKSWFANGLVIGGDFTYYSATRLSNLQLQTYAWAAMWTNNGMGGFISMYSWPHFSITFFPYLLSHFLNFEWSFIERIVYLYPLLSSLVVIPYFVFRKIFPKVKVFYLLTPLIFGLNTYILMVISVGQSFLLLVYALSLLLIYLFYRQALNPKNLNNSILTGLVLGLQGMLDIRITYITLTGVVLYIVFDTILDRFNLRSILIKFVFCLLIPISLLLLIHSYWLVPMLLLDRSIQPPGEEYSTLEAVRYFSFAKFENTISLLHPNWPENIFGKTYFLKPEFLILPIISFLSLLFIGKAEKKEKKIILFFSAITLIGIFIAKGTNDPFGYIYAILFEKFPGFIIFRDSTKWYLLIAWGYTILIPYSLWNMAEYLKKRKKSLLSKTSVGLLAIVFLLFWAISIRQALLGSVDGLLKIKGIPPDYLKLEKFLNSRDDYFRTLWVPVRSRYENSLINHPSINLILLSENKDLYGLSFLRRENALSFLQERSVKYIIVPYDSEGEIFMTDRKYDEDKYLQTIMVLRDIGWLRENKEFGKIKVFELPSAQDHFWSEKENLVSKIKYINPTLYEVEVKNARKGDTVVFAENYDSYWYAIRKEDKTNNQMAGGIQATPYETRLNSFILKDDGDYTLEIFYLPQKWVNIGLFVSGATLIVSFFIIVYTYRKK